MGVEQVLVIRRRVFDELGAFHGLNFEIASYLERFWAGGDMLFMPRPQAEQDPAYKQLIPYVIFACQGRYLCYVRGKRAGETRLTARASIGIGGHINPADSQPLLGGFRAAYLNAVEREVAEEVTVRAAHADRIVAMLNDDTNEVGAVHLGIVHCWRLEQPAVEKREQMITNLAFLAPDELRAMRGRMESWSQLCLDRIEDIARLSNAD